MAVVLYPHNENAYRAASDMLRETGGAAVIHPKTERIGMLWSISGQSEKPSRMGSEGSA